MTRRAGAAAGTRATILEAAHGLLDRREGGTLTLLEVAAAAGVSRATIYKSVGSRRALLAALFEDQGRRMSFDRVLAAARIEDPARAVIATVRECCRAWAVIPLAVRRTLALAVLDDEIGALVARYEGYRRREMGALARRAHAARVTRPGLGAIQVTVALCLLTAFTTFDPLLLEHGARAASRHLVAIVRAALGIETGEE